MKNLIFILSILFFAHNGFTQNPTIISDSLVVMQRVYAKEKLVVDQEAKFKQDIKVLGSARISTDLKVDGEMRVDGLAKFMSNVKMDNLGTLGSMDSTTKVLIIQPNGQVKSVDLKTLQTGLAVVKEDPCNDLVPTNIANPVWSSGLNKIFAHYCGWVKVGIGTSDPQFLLDVRGTTYSLRHLSGNSLATNNAVYNGYSMNHSQTLMNLGVKIGGTPEDVRFTISNSGNIKMTNVGTEPSFVLNNGTGHAIVVYSNSDNKILQLENDGLLRSRRIKVDTDSWADYVFKQGYHLKTLTETETFISENGHLPGVPSGEEIQKDGLDIGEMQKIQMEKIEELYLHVIELEKKINSLSQDNQDLRDIIESNR